jgi:cytidylate kinase
MVHQYSSDRLGEALARAQQHWYSTHPATEPLASLATPERPPLTIAISREAGSNGPAVARAVGVRLDWPVYDQELVELIAGKMGLHAKLVQTVDEKRGSWLSETLSTLGQSRTITEPGYVHQLVRTLLSLAGHGRCIIVGRGAAHVLPADTTLRVRLVAPEPDRIRAVEQRFGISHADAVRWVRKTDRDRADFLRAHFHAELADPRHYDLVLNTARFTTADCADLIVAAVHCRRPEFRSAQLASTREIAQSGNVG